MSTYALEDGTVYLTYSATARGLEFMMGYYGFLDRAPLGRSEGEPPETWVRPSRRIPRREPRPVNKPRRAASRALRKRRRPGNLAEWRRNYRDTLLPRS